MIPKLNVSAEIRTDAAVFLDTLRQTNYSGEIRTDFATRLVTATDNSIYQILPQAVVFPRTTKDVAIILGLASEPTFRTLKVSPRGGGTGTNGQSLSGGIVIDCSKHMREILEINTEERWVRVQPGVILDQLNAALEPSGLFFAPNLSPANRATLGGMINTDACGKGSRVYGRTSSHVLGMTAVLSDGSVWPCEPMTENGLTRAKAREDRVGAVHRLLDEIHAEKHALIEATFPKMDRFLTGYNLAAIYDDAGRFRLDQVICGSEGTLAVVTEAKLNLVPIPAYKGLVAVRYGSFDAALSDAMALLETEPSAIETVDEKILELAREDAIWHRVRDLLGEDADTRTVNLVEYIGETEDAVAMRMNAVSGGDNDRLGCYATTDEGEMSALWDLRKKGVGLLGNMQGNRKPIAFMEDTAVPPSHLADYIAELRALLDSHGVPFAMYGHVDVGCLHVRPALDMMDPVDEKLVRKLSDRVVALVSKYGGVMWAEHGKGFRSEYTPRFFGAALYEDLRRIKAAFDPDNRLNPGKVVTPAGSDEPLVEVEAPLKGHMDRAISENQKRTFANALACNGNGVCFSYDPTTVMCPSSKITHDRIHSPKGRAAILREWLRQLAVAGAKPGRKIPYGPLPSLEPSTDLPDHFGKPGSWLARQHALSTAKGDFSLEVYRAMAGCLSCKACTVSCPIHVDIPDFKARFLHRFHTRYPRPMRDHLVAGMERNLKLVARFPRSSAMMARIFGSLVGQLTGMVDTPTPDPRPAPRRLRARGKTPATPEMIAALDEETRARSVILIHDSFTSFFDAEVFCATHDLLEKLGFHVFVPEWRPNGKPQHIKGFLEGFVETAGANVAFHQPFAGTGVPLVCVEPSIALTYRDEYPKLLSREIGFEVLLVQEWLATRLDEIPVGNIDGAATYALLGHCMEKTALPASMGQWQEIFAALGARLEVLPAGCCGMAGTYGHEREHLAESKGIWSLSWARWFADPERAPRIVATGYSCRTQAKRFAGRRPMHPAEALLAALS